MPSEERSHFLLTYKHCIYICKKRWRKRNLRVTPKLTRNNNRNPSVPQSSKTTNKIITISRNDLQVRLAPQRKLWYSLLCCFCYCLKIKLFILSNSIEKRSFEATAGIWVVLFVMFFSVLFAADADITDNYGFSSRLTVGHYLKWSLAAFAALRCWLWYCLNMVNVLEELCMAATTD